MEKISRILPPSPRTKAAEVSKSQPARPGAPAMGRVEPYFVRPEEIEDRFTLSTADRALEAQTPLYKNTKENARAKIVDDLAKKFFETTPKSVARDSDLTRSEEMVDSVVSNEMPIRES